MKSYSLRAADFQSLASGYGSQDALALLSASQVAKRRLSILAVADEADRVGVDTAAALSDAVELIAAAEAADPRAVREVLAHPYVDAWAADCLRRMHAVPPQDKDIPPQLAGPVAHAGYLAAAAAARAGAEFDLAVAVPTPAVTLPTLGTVGGLRPGAARIRLDRGLLTVEMSGRTITVAAPYTAESRYWAPVRDLIAVAPGRSHVAAIEDLDPYRHCFQWPPMDRLSGADADRMRRLYQDAWGILCQDHLEHADGIGATLQSLVPLRSGTSDHNVSATSSRTFGSLGVSLPEDPPALAMLLIHELQHMKLYGLLDLVDLCRPGPARHRAPWRPDERPTGALLQGVYAHLGVVDFWRQRRSRVGGLAGRAAQFEFALWRAQTRDAAGRLLRAGELTEAGQRFVSYLVQTLGSWQDDPVPADLASVAQDVVVATDVRWQLTNRRPTGADLRMIGAALRAHRPCPPVGPPLAAAEPGPHPSAGLLTPLRAHALNSARRGPVTPADAALLAGRYTEAVAGYTTLIRQDDADGWIGLAVLLGRLGQTGARALARRADLLRALHTEFNGHLTPVELAEWVEPGLR